LEALEEEERKRMIAQIEFTVSLIDDQRYLLALLASFAQ